MFSSEYDSWKTIYPHDFMSKKNIEIIDGSCDSLYDVFAKCRYLITTNSMSLYEGIASGLVPFILKAGWHEEVEDLYKKNIATLVSSEDEIIRMIRGQNGPAPSLPTNHLFRENSLQHVGSFLKQIL